MHTLFRAKDSRRLPECVDSTDADRWDIDRDVIRGRTLELTRKFIPDGLSFANRFEFLDEDQRRLLSQVQGRTYANMISLLESFVGAKITDLAQQRARANVMTAEAAARIADEISKHRALFARIEALVADRQPPGYAFVARAEDFTEFVLERSTWATLALMCEMNLLAQVHYQQSIDPDPDISNLYKDVFFFHWKDESRHVLLHEFQWLRENEKLSAARRERAISDLIELFQGVDAVLVFQAPADVNYFLGICDHDFTAADIGRLHAGVLNAYRWQFLRCGIQDPRFDDLLQGILKGEQLARLRAELGPIMHRAMSFPTRSATRRAGRPVPQPAAAF